MATKLETRSEWFAAHEELAPVHDLDRPAWSTEPDRFLDRFWFVSDTPASGRSLHRV